jgi:beta-lactamase class A
MNGILTGHALLLISLTAACSSGALTQERSAHTMQNAVARKKGELQNTEFQTQLDQIASAAKGRVGVAAVVLETGETVSLNSHDHFPLQSVYKLPISMAVMKQVDSGKLKLEQRVRVTKDDFGSRRTT